MEVLRQADRRRREPHDATAVRSLPLEARVELALREGELAEARLRARRLKGKLAFKDERLSLMSGRRRLRRTGEAPLRSPRRVPPSRRRSTATRSSAPPRSPTSAG